MIHRARPSPFATAITRQEREDQAADPRLCRPLPRLSQLFPAVCLEQIAYRCEPGAWRLWPVLPSPLRWLQPRAWPCRPQGAACEGWGRQGRLRGGLCRRPL